MRKAEKGGIRGGEIFLPRRGKFLSLRLTRPDTRRSKRPANEARKYERRQIQPPPLLAKFFPSPAASHGFQPVVEPRLSHAPVALDRDLGDAQHARRLLDREAAEVAQLDDLRLLLVELGQLAERLVEREQL